MRTVICWVLLGWLALLGSAGLAEENKVALVIGNNKYLHAPRLDNPANDAKLIARTLQAQPA